MAVTLTKVKGPSVICAGFKIATYNAAWDTDYTTGGDAIDLTDDFTYVYNIIVGGNDTLADNGYVIGAIQPAPGTAVTSTNCTLTVNWQEDPADTGGAAIPLPEFTDNGDLSAIGQCSVTVIGF